MSDIGIYFGPQSMDVALVKANKLIAHSVFTGISSGDETQDKVPEEVKIPALLKEIFKQHNVVEKSEVTVALSGKDFIIRTFEIPVIPASELNNAVTYEIKKYIPFRIEEMIFDFQATLDKSLRRYQILFAGVKKDTFEKYNYIMMQSGMLLGGLEYAGFSFLRLLSLVGIREKNSIAVLSVDPKEKDESSFIVIEKGVPIFSRDIAFPVESSAFQNNSSSADFYDKIKREMRISLDYYRRKFPLKEIKKVYSFSLKDDKRQLEMFLTNVVDNSMVISLASRIEGAYDPSSGFLKAFGAGLAKQILPTFKINLILARNIALKSALGVSRKDKKSWIGVLGEEIFLIIFGIVLCLGLHGFMYSKIYPARVQLKGVVAKQALFSSILAKRGLGELTELENKKSAKLNKITSVIKNQVYVAQILDLIPRLLSRDMWLTDLSFGQENNTPVFIISGIVNSPNNAKELPMVKDFMGKVKSDQVIKKYFKEIKISSQEKIKFLGKDATSFIIRCNR